MNVIRTRSSAFYGFSFASGNYGGQWGYVVPDFARLNMNTGLYERIAASSGTWNTWNGWRMCCDDMSMFSLAGNYFIGFYGTRELSIASMVTFQDYHPLRSDGFDDGGANGNAGKGHSAVAVAYGRMFIKGNGNGAVVGIW